MQNVSETQMKPKNPCVLNAPKGRVSFEFEFQTNANRVEICEGQTKHFVEKAMNMKQLASGSFRLAEFGLKIINGISNKGKERRMSRGIKKDRKKEAF